MISFRLLYIDYQFQTKERDSFPFICQSARYPGLLNYPGISERIKVEIKSTVWYSDALKTRLEFIKKVDRIKIKAVPDHKQPPFIGGLIKPIRVMANNAE